MRDSGAFGAKLDPFRVDFGADGARIDDFDVKNNEILKKSAPKARPHVAHSFKIQIHPH